MKDRNYTQSSVRYCNIATGWCCADRGVARSARTLRRSPNSTTHTVKIQKKCEYISITVIRAQGGSEMPGRRVNFDGRPREGHGPRSSEGRPDDPAGPMRMPRSNDRLDRH